MKAKWLLAEAGFSFIALQQWYKFMIGLWERIVFVFLNSDPAMCSRSVQFYPAGYIPAAKNVHDDSKMGVGMFDPGQIAVNPYVQIHFLFDFPDTGRFSGFVLFDLAARKFP